MITQSSLAKNKGKNLATLKANYLHDEMGRATLTERASEPLKTNERKFDPAKLTPSYSSFLPSCDLVE
jgi:hypothetical protein